MLTLAVDIGRPLREGQCRRPLPRRQVDVRSRRRRVRPRGRSGVADSAAGAEAPAVVRGTLLGAEDREIQIIWLIAEFYYPVILRVVWQKS